MRKVLITIWVVFCLGWSAMCIGIYFVGAGLSPMDANISAGFFAYWLVPVLVPALLYRLIRKYRSKKLLEHESSKT
jgi:hypothetical protein